MVVGVVGVQRTLEARGMFVGRDVREDIASSWRRCINLGMDPKSASPDSVCDYNEIYARKQAAELQLELARPEMELLSNQIAGSNYLIAFGDADGVVLDILCDPQACDTKQAKAIVLGSIWREDLQGTNALGLAANLRKPVTVSGGEHFFSSNSDISCLAAPVLRSDGSIAGILNATSPVSDRDRHTANLVNLAALNISNRIFVEDHRHDLIVFCHPRQEYLATQSAGLLSFDYDGRMTGATAIARSILPDIEDLPAPQFSDVFQDGYNSVFESIHSGETAMLRDRRGSVVFVRIRPTRGRLLGISSLAPRKVISVPTIQASEMPTPPRPATSDDFIDQQVAICAETVSAGLPVRICGHAGSGLSEAARAVHSHLEGYSCIEVDCSLSNIGQLDLQLRGQRTEGFDAVFRPLLETPGNVTLILDGIESLGERALPIAKRLSGQISRKAQTHDKFNNWAIIATERCYDQKENLKETDEAALSDFWGYSFCLPTLAERQDLQMLSENILAEFAPRARLDPEVVRLFRQVGNSLTFYSLRRLLFQLSHRGRAKEIGIEHVREILPWLSGEGSVCNSCQGHQTREKKCRRVRKVLRECDGNVSLAARRLGVSRNTIYKHAGKLEL